MYATYDEWPKIAEESYNKDVPKVELSDIDHVVFAGMGWIKQNYEKNIFFS